VKTVQGEDTNPEPAVANCQEHRANSKRDCLLMTDAKIEARKSKHDD